MPIPMVKPPPSAPSPREIAGLCLCLALAGFLLAERVAAGGLPAGDEGSWLAAAAEVAAGNGFATRWLEYHYLEPYALPRPDDMRFPGLTLVLALGMKLFGPSYVAARALVAAIHLASVAAAWYAIRLRFGAACALLAAGTMALSPLQLTWGSAVYCEGLFGLVLAAWLIAVQRLSVDGAGGRTGRPRWAPWAVSGALVAALVLVRPNGLLLAPGLALAGIASLRPLRLDWRGPALGLSVLLVLLSPWLLRNLLEFGNPLHVGGSAGLLRESHQESATLSALEYLARYGVAYPFLRVLRGIPNSLAALHEFEKGLEILPLAFAALAALRRRPFYHPSAAWGFALSAGACAYAGYNSWGGVRYFAPFLPFVYAYGISEALGLIRGAAAALAGRAARRAGATAETMATGAAAASSAKSGQALATAAVAALAVLLVLPVINPHRFYHRHYSSREGVPAAAAMDFAAALDASLSDRRTYLAAELCQINYLGRGLCVGLQGPRREEWLPRALAAFGPDLLALKPAERDGPFGQALLSQLDSLGWSARETRRDGVGVLLRLSRHAGAGWAGAGPDENGPAGAGPPGDGP